MEKQIIDLFKYSRNTYYVWKREKRPIIALIEKYFSEDNLQEFLAQGKITKFERLRLTNTLENELEDLFSSNFEFNFDDYFLYVNFMDFAGEEIDLKTVRNLFYKYLYNEIDHITREVFEFKIMDGEKINSLEEDDTDLVLISLIQTFDRFSDRELKYYIETRRHYNPFRDDKDPKININKA
ncbi:MAG: hypothetical protein COA44_04600 [Arcobacter sp.]|nr:MAG: hypothetical protein COA44_04600 [Arcobacter sp.]